MKRFFSFILVLSLILSLCSCKDSKRYELMQSAENIVSIKLVKKTSGIYENNTDVKYDALYEVDDIKSFLSDFYDIEFNTYLFGDLPELGYGNAIRVEYKDGDVEYIGYDAQLKYAKGVKYNGSRNCSKSAFDSLFEKYIETE